jgi:hypothetical protein
VSQLADWWHDDWVYRRDPAEQTMQMYLFRDSGHNALMQLQFTVDPGVQDGTFSGWGAPDQIDQSIRGVWELMQIMGTSTTDVVIHQNELVEFEGFVRAKFEGAGFSVSEGEVVSHFFRKFRLERQWKPAFTPDCTLNLGV